MTVPPFFRKGLTTKFSSSISSSVISVEKALTLIFQSNLFLLMALVQLTVVGGVLFQKGPTTR